MRVLGVVLYVAVLLCFFTSAFALSCGDNGRAADVCVCNSGYSGLECESAPDDSCVSKEVKADTATDFPKLDTFDGATTFTKNHLKASISSPYVADRQFLELNFTGATSAKCGLGSNGYWTRSSNCSDTFHFDLPWVDHRSCGFVNNTDKSNSSILVITGKLWIRYLDLLEQIEGFNLTRTVSVPYSMSVTFQKNIEVQLLSLNITSDVHFGVALTGDEFDPVEQVLTLELTTIINYPNIFDQWVEPQNLFLPAHILARNYTVSEMSQPNALYAAVQHETSVLSSNIGQASPVCSLYSGTCTQVWTIKVHINSDFANTEFNCTFNGAYAIRYSLYTCRPQSTEYSQNDCTFTPAFVNFTIASSDVCGKIYVEPKVQGKLLAFPGSYDYSSLGNMKSSAITTFKLGQFAHFYADIDSDGNDITLTFNDIKFAPKNGTSEPSVWTYLLRDSKNATESDTKYFNNIHLDVQNDKKAFGLYFHSSVFAVPPEATVHYIISANATIVFAGNAGETKKRNVEFTYEANQMETSAEVGITSKRPTTPVVGDKSLDGSKSDNGVDSVTFIASVVGAVAGTLIIVFVVVGFALRSRNQVEKRDTAASSAVSAANVAAATIDVAVANRL